VVKEVSLNKIWCNWYPDDGHLEGNVEGLDRSFTATCQADSNPAGPLKINPRLNKCKLWGPGHKWVGDPEVVFPSTIPQGSPLRKAVTLPFVRGMGLRVLGALVNWPGTSMFSEDAFTRVVHKLEEVFSLLGNPGGTQIQHCLIRFCLIPAK